MRLTPSTVDAALADEERRQRRRIADGEPVAAAFRPQVVDDADAVDVAEHEVAAEPAIGAQRPLEVDALPAGQRARAW